MMLSLFAAGCNTYLAGKTIVQGYESLGTSKTQSSQWQVPEVLFRLFKVEVEGSCPLGQSRQKPPFFLPQCNQRHTKKEGTHELKTRSATALLALKHPLLPSPSSCCSLPLFIHFLFNLHHLDHQILDH